MPVAVRLHIRAFYLHTYRSVRNGLAMDQAVSAVGINRAGINRALVL